MLAPISWLKDYVDIKVTPERLAEKLVATGFEVEDIIYQNKAATNVKVGKIVEVFKHPNADRLRVTKIDIKEKTIQVVTNVAVEGGEIIAVALDGAALANGINIKAGELRGVLSEGMLCGLEELGLTENDVDGQKKGDIVRFKDETLLGENALDALGYDDVILDVGVTPNRSDCNSIYKLAKEVAVALNTNCKNPHICYKASGGDVHDEIKVEVKNSELCPRYMATAVKDVKIFESSDLIKKRLRAVGIRPINNVVDITNYVLIEIGQPMHAFDRREIIGDKIIVRNAENGEQIVTLDGKNNTLNDSMLVICNSEKPMAVAGIMGGEESGIKDDTKEIIFESAKFARDNIRRTSRRLSLRSDSSQRFEKGIDFASQSLAMDRALTMIYESGSGKIVGGAIDEKVNYKKSRTIEFTTSDIRKILGCAVPKKALISILEKLGIKVLENGKTLIAEVGEDREDIDGVNDIAEEFIRVYGYSHVKPTLFKYADFISADTPCELKVQDSIKDTLAAAGLHECISYSFTSPDFAKKLHLASDDEALRTIKLLNPLGEALSVMRTTLLHSMLELVSYNFTHFNKEAKLFEVAKVYLPKSLPLEELPYEEQRLSIGCYGGDADFYKVKSYVESVLRNLRLSAEYVKRERPYLHTGRSADVIVDGKTVGYVGEVHPAVAREYGLDDLRVYVAEISIDKIFSENVMKKPEFKEFSKFPTVERDLALIVDEDVEVGEILNAVNNGNVQNLTSVSVFDVYKSEQIGAGKKSVGVTFRFSSVKRTLTDDEVAGSMDKILSILNEKVGAALR